MHFYSSILHRLVWDFHCYIQKRFPQSMLCMEAWNLASKQFQEAVMVGIFCLDLIFEQNWKSTFNKQYILETPFKNRWVKIIHPLVQNWVPAALHDPHRGIKLWISLGSSKKRGKTWMCSFFRKMMEISQGINYCWRH